MPPADLNGDTCNIGEKSLVSLNGYTKSNTMKKLDKTTVKTIILVTVLLILAIAFSLFFNRNKGWLSLVIVLSPMISLIIALLINDYVMRKKYNLEKEEGSFRYKGEEEYLPFSEVLRRKHESDRRCLLITVGINIGLLGLMILGALL